MRILIAIIVAIFCLSSQPAYARTHLNVDLVKEHGQQLSKASFYLRFKFEKTTGVKWYSSSYDQRKAFLEDYYTKKAIADKKEDQEKKRKAREEKEKDRERKAERRAEALKVKTEAREKTIELNEQKSQKKDFESTVRDQDRTLRKLRSGQR